MQHLKKNSSNMYEIKYWKKIKKKKGCAQSIYLLLPKTQKQNLVQYYLCAPYLCIIFNVFAPHCGPKI